MAQCNPTTLQAYQQCGDDGNVHWFDSCDQEGALVSTCAACETCVNTSEITAQCDPTTLQAYQQCSDDGGIYWYDSCDEKGSKAVDCAVFGTCTNTSSNNARCIVDDCTGHEDFTFCNVVTFPDRTYDICVSGICVSPGCGDASCNVPGPHFPLPDTNQRLCYNANGAMACPSAGQTFYGQDAQYGWDLLHDESERYVRTVAVSNQPVVADTVTGLAWQGCTAGLSGATCAVGSATSHVWSAALAYCEGLSYGGHTDWRLPDPYELSSIVDSGRHSPSIDPAAFPGTPINRFWSSSSRAKYSSDAWDVSFDYGRVYLDLKSAASRVRCVRLGPFEARRFESLTLSGHRVVKDSLTGLEWQGCAAGLSGSTCATGSATSHTWSAALSYCEGLSYGGHTDWRLPNRAELQSIVDQRRNDPSIDPVMFPATPLAGFWSSSSRAFDSSYAWAVDFVNGLVGYGAKASGFRVRCVRLGP
jgi:hypothetical protein